MALVLSALVLCATARGDGAFMSRPRYPVIEPSQAALIVFHEGTEDLTLQVSYEGAAEEFAWVVPAPARPAVARGTGALFRRLEALTNPPVRRNRLGGFGGGLGGRRGAGVALLERERVGVYDVSVLDADSAKSLASWLETNGYPVAERAGRVFHDYIRRGWYFTAMRVDPTLPAAEPGGPPAEMAAGPVGEPASERRLVSSGELHPLRLTFRSPAPVYPLRISSLNRGTSDLLLYVAASGPARQQGFAVQYDRPIAAQELNKLTESHPRVVGDLHLTRLYRRMRSEQMTADLVFDVRQPDPDR